MIWKMFLNSLSGGTVIISALAAFTFALEYYPAPWIAVFGVLYAVGAGNAIRSMSAEVNRAIKDEIRA